MLSILPWTLSNQKMREPVEVDQRVASTATWCSWAEEPCMDQPWLLAPMWAEALWQLTTWYCCCTDDTAA